MERKKDELDEYVVKYVSKRSPANIVKFEGGYAFLGDVLLDAQEIASIARDCKFIRETRVWALFNETIGNNAITSMISAQDVDAMRPGKWMIGVLNDLNTMMTNFELLAERTKITPKKTP
jgi:hypothetical protein